MNTDGYSLAATVILLLPMLYFFLSSMTFLLASLRDPTVTWLLRGLFNTYFLGVIGCCAIGILAFVSAGRPAVAAGIGLVAVFAIGARRWFLRQMDAHICARDAGDAHAVRQLRRLHFGGMLYNGIQTTVVIASIPHVFVPT
jgi:hypothetical protein